MEARTCWLSVVWSLYSKGIIGSFEVGTRSLGNSDPEITARVGAGGTQDFRDWVVPCD